jgi:heptosyltransferase III
MSCAARRETGDLELMNLDMPQRIVIYRLGSLGDTVVALPCFHKVARTWPSAERIVLTNFPVSSNAAPLEAILRDGGLIHSSIVYPVGTRSLHRLWTLTKQLRSLRADVLVYLTPARGLPNAIRDWAFFKLCGFKRIVGVPLTQDLQNCRQLDSQVPGGPPVEERECERLARCLHELGPIDLDDPGMWDLHLTQDELRAGASVLVPLLPGHYFAINMGGKAKEKDWGMPNWYSLLKLLSDRYPQTGLLIVGAAEDSERARDLASAWKGPVVDACGKLNPRESAAAMRQAAAFIGHDSGPLHLAAATGVSCVGLFGNFNQPERWHPRGPQHRIIHHMNGLDTISAADVMKAVGDIVPLRQECA